MVRRPFWLASPKALGAPEAAAPGADEAADVLVVGAGVIGLSIAYWLARTGAVVAVLDRADLGSGASGGNAGLYLPGSGALEGSGLLEEVAETESWDLQLRRIGHLALATSPEVLAQMEREIAARRPGLPELRLLDRAGCAALLGVPLPRAVLGGRWYPAGATLHPGRLLAALARSLVGRGGRLLRGRVRTVSVEADGVRASGDGWEVRAAQGVVAAGRATPDLLPELSSVLVPQRGQMLALRAPLGTLPVGLALDWGRVYARQAAGNLVAGGRRDADPDAEGSAVPALNGRVQTALEGTVRELFPSASRITARWAAVMDSTPDGRPVAGRLGGRGRVWVVAGFGGHGLPPAMGVGRAVAAGIAGGTGVEVIADLDPGRFC